MLAWRWVLFGGIGGYLNAAGQAQALSFGPLTVLKTLAEANRVSTRLIAPPRGRLLDRSGTVIAGNRQNWRALFIAELAEDAGVNLNGLRGSGPGGRFHLESRAPGTRGPKHQSGLHAHCFEQRSGSRSRRHR
jgi:hypothetical protein